MRTYSPCVAERNKARALVKGRASLAHVAKIERATRLDRVVNTFASVILKFPAKREKEGIEASSAERNRRLIEKHLASISNLPVAEVSTPALLAVPTNLLARLGGKHDT